MAAEVVFGHYRLLDLLGRGGMGEVWRAHDTLKNRDVALKVLGAWLRAEPEYGRRFRREAALAAGLSAPHIIAIHDYGEIDGRLFIEMPLISGVDLDALLAREGPLPPDRAVGIIEQIADALDVAHGAGLVHRDVKPSNVLVTTRRGRDFAYLIDFGIARAVDSTSISRTGMVIGTLGYMAPERFDGEGDHRVDVYALSCVLYTALTGHAPFPPPARAIPLGFYLDAHRSRTPPRPSHQDSAIPAGFDAVVARGMAERPADRYLTAGDLAEAAHAALAGSPAAAVGPGTPPTQSPRPAEPTELAPEASAVAAPLPSAAPQPAPPAPPRQWSRRRKTLLSAFSALLLGLLTVLVVQGTSPHTGTSVPHTTTAAGLPPPAFGTGLTLINAVTEVFAVATAQLDGRTVVISAGVDETVRVWDLATGAPVGAPFTGHTDSVVAVATAQLDGRTVVISAGADNTIRVSDLATGAAVGTPFTGHTDGVNTVATAQLNGHTVVVSDTSDNKIRLWDLATGTPLGAPFTGHTGTVNAVAIAQLDGRTVVVSGSNDHTVRVRDLATGAPVGAPFTGHTDGVGSVTTAELNGRTVVISGSGDSTIRVSDLATGAAVGTPFTGHTAPVFGVATAQLDGRTVVVSTSSDHTVRVWDLATGSPVGAPFTAHTDTVSTVATARLNGRPVVVSGSADGTIRVWDLGQRAHS